MKIFHQNILYLLLLLTLFNACTSRKVYERYKGLPQEVNIKHLEIVDFIKLNEELYIFSAYNPKHSHQIHLYVTDAQQKIIYKSGSQGDSQTYSLSVFKAKKKDSYIVLGHIASEYSWGNDVHLIENNQVKNIGFLNAAKYNKNDQAWDISACVKIEALNQKEFAIRFECDKLVYDPEGPEQEIINCSEIYYLFKGDKLKLIIN